MLGPPGRYGKRRCASESPAGCRTAALGEKPRGAADRSSAVLQPDEVAMDPRVGAGKVIQNTYIGDQGHRFCLGRRRLFCACRGTPLPLALTSVISLGETLYVPRENAVDALHPRPETDGTARPAQRRPSSSRLGRRKLALWSSAMTRPGTADSIGYVAGRRSAAASIDAQCMGAGLRPSGLS